MSRDHRYTKASWARSEQTRPMQIESIEIRNYRLFRDAELRDLPRLAVVVGSDGSGKSALFDVFTFLKDALTQNVSTAVARRGGFRELVSRGEKGPIRIVVWFREPDPQRNTSRSFQVFVTGVRRLAAELSD